MAVAALVSPALESGHKRSDFTFKQKLLSNEPLGVNSPAHRNGELNTSGMVNIKQRMEAETISERAAKLITDVR